MDYDKIEFLKKQYITEWKNVNDKVHQITSEICTLILNDIQNRTKYLSKIYKLPYFENKEGIKYNFVTAKGKSEDVLIEYTLYLTDSEEESRNIIKSGLNFNSSWEEDTKTMIIVSTLVNNKPSQAFKEAIEHESEHMYEYAMGLQKKVDLYDKMIDNINNKQNEPHVYYTNLALYYTFVHEQNAFKQQFYVYLNQLNKKISFEDALENYTPYRQMDNAFDAVYDFYDNKDTLKAINDLGYKRRTYYKRLYYGYNRFIEKLKSVYQRWYIENKDKFLTKEQRVVDSIYTISRQMELSEGKTFIEKEKNKIEYKNEFFI